MADVSFHTSLSKEEALAKIKDSTEGESLPFVSKARHPRSRFRFVSNIHKNKFRLWPVPYSSRYKRKWCLSYLRGVVVADEHGANVRGAFLVHPFARMMSFLPLAIVIPTVIWGKLTVPVIAFLLIPTTVFVAVQWVLAFKWRSICSADDSEIVQFLINLLPRSTR